MKKFNLKSLSLLVFLFIAYLFICAHSYVVAVSGELSNSVFRLHILANSDSDEDQSLKLKVRDSLLSYMNDICANCSTKREAIEVASNHIDEFKNIAKKTISDNGYDYDVNIKIGNFYFPTKYYGNISLPSSYYDALRVEIGNAEGQNWWCVMFPSLCFIDVSSGIVDDDAKENLKENMSEESYNIVSENEDLSFDIKFKIIELFAQRDFFTAKN